MADWLERYRGYILITLINLIVLGGVVILMQSRPQFGAGASQVQVIVSTPTPLPPTSTPAPAHIVVYVCGAVVNPGVYSLLEGSRVKEAVEAAGDFAPDADRVRINLARRLSDGEQVYIPRVGEEVLPVTPPAAAPGPLGGKININTATAEELDTLPGIGPAYAERIIKYREEFGPFKKIEDIKKVRGIGDATFEEIKDLITVSPTVAPPPTSTATPTLTATSTPTEMPTSPPEVTDTPTSTPEAAMEIPTVTSTPTTEVATLTATSTLTPTPTETTEGESAAD